MSSVYGSPLFIGGSQQISDLPPLLSNFRASIDESQTGQVILSADKMEESRAKDLAGAVWVYGDHAPKNANDGTRIELTRDEVINPDAAQTFATGKTIADLPSKSKVKLGRYGGKDLVWELTKDTSNQALRMILNASSMDIIGGKMFDNKEPSNPDSNRRDLGNNCYIWSNLHQWLNSDKPANQWYAAQHKYDAPPNYTNINGFLYEWNESERNVLDSTNWTVTRHSADGGGSEVFQSRVTLPSTTEMGLNVNTGGGRLDIFNNDTDRKARLDYWCRTPHTGLAYNVLVVSNSGTEGASGGANNPNLLVRPLCSPNPSTLVSNEPDSDGCYTIQIEPTTIERTISWDTNKNFYARQFTYNSKKQYQTMLEGATAELLLGEVPLPVSNLAISENAGASPTLSWKNPTDKNYHETVVVQKEGSTPPALQMTE